VSRAACRWGVYPLPLPLSLAQAVHMRRDVRLPRRWDLRFIHGLQEPSVILLELAHGVLQQPNVVASMVLISVGRDRPAPVLLSPDCRAMGCASAHELSTGAQERCPTGAVSWAEPQISECATQVAQNGGACLSPPKPVDVAVAERQRSGQGEILEAAACVALDRCAGGTVKVLRDDRARPAFVAPAQHGSTTQRRRRMVRASVVIVRHTCSMLGGTRACVQMVTTPPCTGSGMAALPGSRRSYTISRISCGRLRNRKVLYLYQLSSQLASSGALT
jgi:hypothetical protein